MSDEKITPYMKGWDCPICGKHFVKLAAKHANTHGMTLNEMKKKYNIPLDKSLSISSMFVKDKEREELNKGWRTGRDRFIP